MQELTLYFKPTCPYCGKVLQYLQDNDIIIPLKNITESDEARQELITIGGKQQVPCLMIDGEALYESLDIIEWLKNNFTV